MDVADGFEQVVIGFDGNAEEPVLEHMADAVSERVVVMRILREQAFHHKAEVLRGV